MQIENGKTFDIVCRLLVAAALFVAITFSLTAGSSFAASGDADDDGVADSDDNCGYVSNADQVDDVSAFLVPGGYNEYGKAVHTPLWAPADKGKTRIFVDDVLKISGIDYIWNTDGQIEWINAPVNSVWLVVLGDSDGAGDKCSPNLGVDFDGIPDKADNCPLIYNPYQEDTWGTSAGDACESGDASPTDVYQVWAKMYEHANYTGVEEVIRVNDILLTGNAIGDNALSSIRVGPHTAVYVYTLPNYGGTSEFFSSDDSDFMDNTVGHDTVSSIRMFSTAPISVTKISVGLDFWSGIKGHVGLIIDSELETLVGSGSGSAVTLQHDFVDSVQSITVTYNGGGDYLVSTTNLDGSAGEIAHFHYEGITETVAAVASTVVTATATPTPAPAATQITSSSYIVQSGDYLFKIATLYNTSVQVLSLTNNITNADLIFVGQILTIP